MTDEPDLELQAARLYFSWLHTPWWHLRERRIKRDRFEAAWDEYQRARTGGDDSGVHQARTR